MIRKMKLAGENLEFKMTNKTIFDKIGRASCRERVS